MTKIIKQYIQFAIDNGYNFNLDILSKFTTGDLINPKEVYKDGIYYLDEPRRDINNTLNIWVSLMKWENVFKGYVSIYETITSKPFIEAIARGIRNTKPHQISHNSKQKEYLICPAWYMTDNEIEDKLTTLQAIAIRDNKLDGFIDNLLTK